VGRLLPLRYSAASPKEARMTTTIAIGPLVALIAGILILIIPRLLNYIIALYLIIIGLLGLFGPPRATIAAHWTGEPPAAVEHVSMSELPRVRAPA
jgi:hypothetical protein